MTLQRRVLLAGADPRVEATRLVEMMTLDEKLGCLDGDTPFWPGIVDLASGGYHSHPAPAAKQNGLVSPACCLVMVLAVV